MALPIVLPRERFAADGANKRSLVSVGAQVGPQIIGSCKAFRTQVALEGGRMLLHPFGVVGRGTRPLWIGQIQDVVAIVDRRCR